MTVKKATTKATTKAPKKATARKPAAVVDPAPAPVVDTDPVPVAGLGAYVAFRDGQMIEFGQPAQLGYVVEHGVIDDDAAVCVEWEDGSGTSGLIPVDSLTVL